MSAKRGPAECTALEWFKSSYSNGQHDTDCVEVAGAPDVVHVRDSKDVRRPSFSVPRTTWAAFVKFASER